MTHQKSGLDLFQCWHLIMHDCPQKKTKTKKQQRLDRTTERDREKEKGKISKLGKTTQPYRGIIMARPDKREGKSVPISTDGNERLFVSHTR